MEQKLRLCRYLCGHESAEEAQHILRVAQLSGHKSVMSRQPQASWPPGAPPVSLPPRTSSPATPPGHPSRAAGATPLDPHHRPSALTKTISTCGQRMSVQPAFSSVVLLHYIPQLISCGHQIKSETLTSPAGLLRPWLASLASCKPPVLTGPHLPATLLQLLSCFWVFARATPSACNRFSLTPNPFLHSLTWGPLFSGHLALWHSSTPSFWAGGSVGLSC